MGNLKTFIFLSVAKNNFFSYALLSFDKSRISCKIAVVEGEFLD